MAERIINQIQNGKNTFKLVDHRIDNDKFNEISGVQANATNAIGAAITTANNYADNVGATARNVAATNLKTAINTLTGKPQGDENSYTVYGAQSGAAGVQSQLSGVQSGLETRIGSLENALGTLTDGTQVTNLIDNVNRIRTELLTPTSEAGMQGETYLDKLDKIIDTKEIVESTSGATNFLKSVSFGYQEATGADSIGTLILNTSSAQVIVNSTRTFIAGKQKQQP